MGQKNSSNRKKTLITKDQIVIGIDFGSCGITYAYGFLDNPKREPYLGKFNEQGINDKVSTEIILDENLKVLKFGNECKKFLAQIQKKKFYHFNNIKMKLYKREYKIKAQNSEDSFDVEMIITKILKLVKEKAIQQIKKSVLSLKEENIHWVITVPAIWEIKSKQVMINAADKAGLIREDDDPSNFFALEPEAASIYYHNSPHAMKNDDIDTGKPFILCDLGSGTADIVTQKKVKENNEIKFQELYPPIGGDCGCNKINENFIDKVIKELFGEKCFNETKKYVCKTKYNNWFEFESKIEEFKKTYTEKEQMENQFSINCEIFEKYCEEDLKKLIKDFNSKHKEKSWNLEIEDGKGWKILFPFKIINDLMQELMDEIKNKYLSKIIESRNDIKTLVFTGGASSNPILFDMIQSYKDLNIKSYVQSPNPEIAIAFGSVQYSFDHYVISPRKAKFTFGIKTSDIWNETMHKNGGKKVYDKVDKVYRCKNAFTKFITINDNLRPYDEISHRFIMNNSKAFVVLYKTSRKNATFIDETDEKGNFFQICSCNIILAFNFI